MMSSTARTNTTVKKDRTKKKGDDVGKLSPTHSEIEDPIAFKVIDGEDIQALAIKEDDLKKFNNPKQTQEEKVEGLLVKKKNKNTYPTIEVKVAKLVPDKPLKPIDVSDNLGIRFDKYGNCVPHSILGTVEDYLQESVVNGNSIELPYDTLDSDRPNADFYLKTKRTDSLNKTLNGDNGENALNNWRKRLLERKDIQSHVSNNTKTVNDLSLSTTESINRQISELVMNQADNARNYNEIKTLIDRTLPLVEHGKGYRLGSEFWNQHILIGSEENGIHKTLTESEKGNLPPIEHISKPLISIEETDFKENQPPVINYPWHQSNYLKDRLKKLDPLIKELVPHNPEFSNLQVLGVNPLRRSVNDANSNHKPSIEFDIDKTWTNPNIFNKQDKSSDQIDVENVNPYLINIDTASDPFSSYPDIIEPPVFGPCIVFGGQTAKWTGGNIDNLGVVALESRLNFETKAGKRVLATFEILNVGTTIINYDWKKITEYNPFDVVNYKIQRFYFDTRSNIILPGDLLKLHVVFKSVKGGIFTEKWEFVTQPRLLNGASLVLTLRGVAVQEDKYKKTRASIERKLFVKEAELIAKSMVELILSGVRTPERSQTPQNAYITEEDIFTELNPNFFYDHETIVELKKIYLELFEESERAQNEWNLSIDNFKSRIMVLDELDPKKQDLLLKLNNLLTNMSFQVYSPNYSKMYSVCYNVLCQTVDDIYTDLASTKTSLNLPAVITEEYPLVDEFNARYEEWKKEFEIFKQIENEKKNRQEKEKGKDKGKKGDNKKEEKKKDADRKKATPTPGSMKQKSSKELTMSRSASRNQEKLDDRSKTPAGKKTPVTLSEEQIQASIVFEEKAYLNTYQMLCKMIDNIETIFSEIVDSQDMTQRLSNIVNQPKLILSNNSDYID